jgi:hypothetical protein
LNSDATFNQARPIRGLLTVTGENLMDDSASSTARTIVCDVPDMAEKDFECRARCMAECRKYSGVTADFIGWLLAQGRTNEFADRVREQEAAFYKTTQGQPNDGRVAANFGFLAAGYRQFTEYMGQAAPSGWESEVRGYLEEDLPAMLAGMMVSVREQRPIEIFWSVLGQLIKNGRVRLDPEGTGAPVIGRPDPFKVGMVLKHARQDRLYALYVTALDTGMRPGEMFALEWSDVDFTGAHVTVTKSLEEIAGHLRVKDAKTKKGRRRIDLTPETLAALNDHRKRMLAEGHAAGPVFCNNVGTHLRISDVRLASFKAIINRANKAEVEAAAKAKRDPVLLPDIRLYDLRHSSATLLLLADVPAKVVSERLGHSTINLTLDTYSHVLPTMQKSASQKMSKILGHASKVNVSG